MKLGKHRADWLVKIESIQTSISSQTLQNQLSLLSLVLSVFGPTKVKTDGSQRLPVEFKTSALRGCRRRRLQSNLIMDVNIAVFKNTSMLDLKDTHNRPHCKSVIHHYFHT